MKFNYTNIYLFWRDFHGDDHDYGHGDRDDRGCDRVCDGDVRGCGRDYETNGRGGYDLPQLLTLARARVLILVEVLNSFSIRI